MKPLGFGKSHRHGGGMCRKVSDGIGKHSERGRKNRMKAKRCGRRSEQSICEDDERAKL